MQQPLVGQDLLCFEASQSHSHTKLCRTPLDECSAPRRDHHVTTYNTDTDIHAFGEIRTRNSSKRVASHSRHRPRDIPYLHDYNCCYDNEWKWLILPGTRVCQPSVYPSEKHALSSDAITDFADSGRLAVWGVGLQWVWIPTREWMFVSCVCWWVCDYLRRTDRSVRGVLPVVCMYISNFFVTLKNKGA